MSSDCLDVCNNTQNCQGERYEAAELLMRATKCHSHIRVLITCCKGIDWKSKIIWLSFIIKFLYGYKSNYIEYTFWQIILDSGIEVPDVLNNHMSNGARSHLMKKKPVDTEDNITELKNNITEDFATTESNIKNGTKIFKIDK